ncbi:hypothetical protein HZC21_00810 [Candidatus Peregrinibacteria bacterium]|nr:hypothetical protein [Candidatus Peregrinibacteria bacterium]
MKIFKQHEGVSLIVATLFASALMLASAGLAEVMIQITRERADSNHSKMAENLVDSVIGAAASAASEKGVGANINSEDLSDGDLAGIFKNAGWIGVENCADINPDPSVKKRCLGFRVIGRTEEAARFALPSININSPTFYSVPAAYYDDAKKKIIGTGNASEECKDFGNADDPCYWNKIYVGERIELYPKVVSFAEYKNPIKNYPYANPKKDPVLLQWIISDLAGAKDESLMASEDIDNQYDKRPYPKSDDPEDEFFFVGKNTEISGGRINDAANYPSNSDLILNNFIVLESHHKAKDLDYNKDDPEIGDAIVDLGKPIGATENPLPTLRLNLVGQPRQRKPFDINKGYDSDLSSEDLNDFSLFVPYLEYQILTTGEPIADSKKTFSSWAQLGDFYKKSKGFKALPVTEGGFTLGNL